jgi:hypothetical protein
VIRDLPTASQHLVLSPLFFCKEEAARIRPFIDKQHIS